MLPETPSFHSPNGDSSSAPHIALTLPSNPPPQFYCNPFVSFLQAFLMRASLCISTLQYRASFDFVSIKIPVIFEYSTLLFFFPDYVIGDKISSNFSSFSCNFIQTFSDFIGLRPQISLISVFSSSSRGICLDFFSYLFRFSIEICFNMIYCIDSNRRYSEGIYCLRDRKSLKGITTASKKVKTSSDVLSDKDLSHLVWWKEVKLVFSFC